MTTYLRATVAQLASCHLKLQCRAHAPPTLTSHVTHALGLSQSIALSLSLSLSFRSVPLRQNGSQLYNSGAPLIPPAHLFRESLFPGCFVPCLFFRFVCLVCLDCLVCLVCLVFLGCLAAHLAKWNSGSILQNQTQGPLCGTKLGVHLLGPCVSCLQAWSDAGLAAPELLRRPECLEHVVLSCPASLLSGSMWSEVISSGAERYFACPELP